MNTTDILALSPLAVLAATAVAVMLGIAFSRNHLFTVFLTLTGLGLSLAALPAVFSLTPRHITPLLVLDRYALFYMGLILAATFMVSVLSYGYLEKQEGEHEEFHLLLLVAALGSLVLVASSHFASFFLGLEILSISLYALIAYLREEEHGIEAGVKYLILAAVSSAFLLFGMALIYAEAGTMEFREIAAQAAIPGTGNLLLLAGTAMMITGIGFKLAIVPFHLWTPDVYQGAPAPVTAFIATVSKGAVFALLLRYFTEVDIHVYGRLFPLFIILAVSSMLVGNLLALLQDNVKRLLAYSSIAHLGYLLVAFEAGGPASVTAATYYLAAYFPATLGAFGVMTVLSGRGKEAENLQDYQGLAWRRPWLSGAFTVMLFSLAGLPLTAGFVGKFFVAAAGVGSALWLPVITLAVSSVVGLFYYLRVVAVMFMKQPEKATGPAPAPAVPLAAALVLAALVVLLVLLGVYPSPFIGIIQTTAARLL